MEENNSKKTSKTIIAVIIVIGLVLLVMVKVSLDNLAEAIINYNNVNSNNDTTYVDQEDTDWEYRFDELEAKIAEQSRNIEEMKITFGECDVNKKTVEIKIIVIPKEYTKDTKVTVTVGEYSSELKLKKNKFSGTVQVPYDEVYELYYVAIEMDGKVKNEKVNVYELDEDFWNWNYELIDRVYGKVDYDSDFEDNKYNLYLNKASIEVDETEKSTNFPTLYVTRNDEIVFQQTMKYNEKESCYESSCNKEFEYEDNDMIKCYAEYTGKSGLKYKVNYYAESYNGDGASCETYEDRGASVYGIDGKKIEFKYMNEDEAYDEDDDWDDEE